MCGRSLGTLGNILIFVAEHDQRAENAAGGTRDVSVPSFSSPFSEFRGRISPNSIFEHLGGGASSGASENFGVTILMNRTRNAAPHPGIWSPHIATSETDR